MVRDRWVAVSLFSKSQFQRCSPGSYKKISNRQSGLVVRPCIKAVLRRLRCCLPWVRPPVIIHRNNRRLQDEGRQRLVPIKSKGLQAHVWEHVFKLYSYGFVSTSSYWSRALILQKQYLQSCHRRNYSLPHFYKRNQSCKCSQPIF